MFLALVAERVWRNGRRRGAAATQSAAEVGRFYRPRDLGFEREIAKRLDY